MRRVILQANGKFSLMALPASMWLKIRAMRCIDQWVFRQDRMDPSISASPIREKYGASCTRGTRKTLDNRHWPRWKDENKLKAISGILTRSRIWCRKEILIVEEFCMIPIARPVISGTEKEITTVSLH